LERASYLLVCLSALFDTSVAQPFPRLGFPGRTVFCTTLLFSRSLQLQIEFVLTSPPSSDVVLLASTTFVPRHGGESPRSASGVRAHFTAECSEGLKRQARHAGKSVCHSCRLEAAHCVKLPVLVQHSPAPHRRSSSLLQVPEDQEGRTRATLAQPERPQREMGLDHSAHRALSWARTLCCPGVVRLAEDLQAHILPCPGRGLVWRLQGRHLDQRGRSWWFRVSNVAQMIFYRQTELT
jgi:hypothetical protein